MYDKVISITTKVFRAVSDERWGPLRTFVIVRERPFSRGKVTRLFRSERPCCKPDVSD